MNDAPIGIFDSGLGGLTVTRAILDQLPNEQVRYLGDNANAPYGPKPLGAIRAMALDVMDRLVADGVKMLVIACNTAASVALRDARERYTDRHGIPVIEVILPAARAAVHATRSGKIGVIATKSTVQSLAYDDAFHVTPGLQIITQACPEFVRLVEEGRTSGDEVMKYAREYLDPVKAAGVDTLVLGCTHYPLLRGAISYVMGDDVTLVSSADETAKDVYRKLVEHGLERSAGAGAPVHTFLTTGEPARVQPLAHRFLGPEVALVEAV
ncbi:glutamate racemase [Myceligenerans crystallogenes]|uniref:Glutamate racemase n=1 Tax=Myceligenerans crystallogenes TaxID=316335 RepID=A0ABP4ZHC9_9MICO